MKAGKFVIPDVQCAEDGNGTGSGLSAVGYEMLLMFIGPCIFVIAEA